MKKLLFMVVVSVVCLGLVSSCACPKNKSVSCPATKCPATVQTGASIDQCPVMSKLNLSDAQKAEVQRICDKCAKAGCPRKACKEMTKELEKVLTPEQMTQFKAACNAMKGKSGGGMKAEKSCCAMKARKGECPMKKSDELATESK
jgi:hypothetical protein